MREKQQWWQEKPQQNNNNKNQQYFNSGGVRCSKIDVKHTTTAFWEAGTGELDGEKIVSVEKKSIKENTHGITV